MTDGGLFPAAPDSSSCSICHTTSIYIGKAPTEIILSELFCFTDTRLYAEPFSENLCVVIVDHVFDIRKICRALEELSKLGETAQGIGIPIGAGSGLYADIFEHRAQSFKALLKAFAVHILSLCPAGLGNSPEDQLDESGAAGNKPPSVKQL